MVIGFDASRAFVPGRTGTENYSYQLLKALAKIDRKNQYVVFIRPLSSSVIASEQSERGLPAMHSKALQADNLPTWEDSSLASSSTSRSGLIVRNDKNQWPSNFYFKLVNWPRLWTQGGLASKTFTDPLDVLFVPAHTLPLVRKPGLKTVVTVHDLGSEYLPAMHQLKQQLYLGFMQRFQLKGASQIIAVSQATKKDLVSKIKIEPEKISVVYEGFDQKLYKPVKEDAVSNSLKQYGLEAGKYFLFVGTVQPRKNLERLIIAFSRFITLNGSDNDQDLGYKMVDRGKKDAESKIQNPKSKIQNPISLVIAGSKGWLSEDIYQLPKKLGIEGRVKFLGYVPDTDLPALYSGAIALTFPSLFEGFGLPILEAQACGCPVITSQTSSMPEVGGTGALYVNPEQVDDIVKGMIRIKNKELRIKLIQAGFENIKRFGWEKCARETLSVLKKIAS